MRAERVLSLSGPNVWSNGPVLEAWIHADDGRDGTATHERLAREKSSLSTVSAAMAQSAECWTAATAGQVLQELWLSLLRRVGEPSQRGWVRPTGSAKIVRCVVECDDELIAKRCLELALRWYASAVQDESLPLAELLSDLQGFADDRRLGRITGPIVAAARARGIPAFRLDAESLVQLGQGSRQRRVRTATTDRTGFIAEAVARDKQLTKNLLAQLGLPVPIGRVVSSEDDAWTAATDVGWPVVVKPRDADFGNGVSLRLRTRDEIIAAYRQARQFSDTVIVEQQLEGFPHRVLIIGEKIVGAVRREPAHVIGDGRHTVLELIEELNRDPRRGSVDDKTTPWFPVEADATVQTALVHQGLDWQSVPAAGCVIDLRWQSCDWQGDCMYDATDDIHPDVAESLIDAVRLIGLDVAGVDLIATDLMRPLGEQRGGILEINAEPAILVHMRPVCQPSRPIPEAIVSHLFPRPDDAHIPIIALLSDPATDDISRWLSRWLQVRGDRVGRAARDGSWLGQRRLSAEPSDHAFRVRSLLLHPRVDAVVCQLSAESLRSEGLPFDRSSAAVLLSQTPLSESGPVSEPLSAERLLARVGASRGFVVINADDPQLAKLVAELGAHALPISLDASNPHIAHAREHGWRAACLRGEAIVLSEGRHELLINPPATPNLALLAATATAWGLGMAPESLHWDSGPTTTPSTTSSRIDTGHTRQRVPESYSPV